MSSVEVSWKTFGITVVLVALAMTSTPRQASAIFFITGGASMISSNSARGSGDQAEAQRTDLLGQVSALGAVGCMAGAFLTGSLGFFICTLSERSEDLSAFPEDYFRENGYSMDEEIHLRVEHARFQTALAQQQIDLVLQRGDDRQALTRSMLTVVPDISPSYIALMSEILGVR